jgi:spore coat protein SA
VWVQNAPDFASALASRIHGGGGKVVLHKHNTFSVSRSAESVAKIIRSVDKVVFCCNYLNLDTRERFPWFQHSAIIANGADSSLFYPEVQKGSNSKPIIAFAGRIVKEKGVHILLNAMRILLERRVDVEARIFGGSAFGGSKPTPYLTDLEAAAPPNVKFMGYAASKDLARHLRTADVFCSPSIWNEPFAMVNLEAMASGLPVVTTRVGGVPEAFTEGGGVLVPPGSSVALANALESVIKNPELRERLSHEGRQAFLKRFTWNCISRQYHELAGSL